MKKLPVLFLGIAIMISLCAFSCGDKTQSADGDAVVENTAQKNSGNNAPSDTLIDWMIGGTYYMKYTLDMEADGGLMTMKGVMAVQDDNISSTSEMIVAGQTVKSRMLALGKTTYIIDDSLKMIMKSPISFSDLNQGTANYSKMKKTGSGTGTVKGKTLPYEEYQSDGVTSKFYIDGNKVYAIESTGKGTKTLLIIEEQSKTVPRGSFDLPNGYTSF